MSGKFYVYFHRRRSDGSIFYVGKGSGGRAWVTGNRKPRWKRSVSKTGFYVEIYRDNMSEVDAYSLEEKMIAKFRRDGVWLANVASGGSRESGWTHNEETRKKMSDKQKTKRRVFSSDGVEYESICAARSDMMDKGYPRACVSGIVQALDNPSRTAYGRSWSSVSVPDTPKYTGRDKFGKATRVMVECDELGVFESATDASATLVSMGLSNARPQSISNCCNGRQKSAYGYVWRKADAMQANTAA